MGLVVVMAVALKESRARGALRCALVPGAALSCQHGRGNVQDVLLKTLNTAINSKLINS